MGPNTASEGSERNEAKGRFDRVGISCEWVGSPEAFLCFVVPNDEPVETLRYVDRACRRFVDQFADFDFREQTTLACAGIVATDFTADDVRQWMESEYRKDRVKRAEEIERVQHQWGQSLVNRMFDHGEGPNPLDRDILFGISHGYIREVCHCWAMEDAMDATKGVDMTGILYGPVEGLDRCPRCGSIEGEWVAHDRAWKCKDCNWYCKVRVRME